MSYSTSISKFISRSRVYLEILRKRYEWARNPDPIEHCCAQPNYPLMNVTLHQSMGGGGGGENFGEGVGRKGKGGREGT